MPLGRRFGAELNALNWGSGPREKFARISHRLEERSLEYNII